MIPPPPLPFPPPSTWWQRNWPWFVPTGCLCLLLILAVFVGGILLLVSNVMKSSEVYQTAVRRAETNGRVADALGAPLREGFLPTGSVRFSNDAGEANLAIPLQGPKARGTIYVVATKTEGVWSYSRMEVRVKGTGQTIDLRDLPR